MTSMTNERADSAFQALHDVQRAARILCMALRNAGDRTGAANAKLRADLLQDEIDKLINKELADWQAEAESVIPELVAAVDAAKEAAGQVEQDVKNARLVVFAIATLDNAITIAMKLIG